MAVGSDYKVQVWDIDTGNLIKTLFSNQSPLFSVYWHPEGSYLTTYGADNRVGLRSYITIWDSENFIAVSQNHPYDNVISPWGWNETGERFTITDLRGAQIFDFTGENLLLEFADQQYRWAMLAPGGENLAEVYPNSFEEDFSDYTIRIWDVNQGEIAASLTEPQNFAKHISWSSDSQYLVVTSAEQKLRVWQRPQ